MKGHTQGRRVTRRQTSSERHTHTRPNGERGYSTLRHRRRRLSGREIVGERERERDIRERERERHILERERERDIFY